MLELQNQSLRQLMRLLTIVDLLEQKHDIEMEELHTSLYFSERTGVSVSFDLRRRYNLELGFTNNAVIEYHLGTNRGKVYYSLYNGTSFGELEEVLADLRKKP